MSVELKLNNHLDEIDYVSLCHNLHGVVVVVADERDKVVVGMSFYTRERAGKEKRDKKDETWKKKMCHYIYQVAWQPPKNRIIVGPVHGVM